MFYFMGGVHPPQNKQATRDKALKPYLPQSVALSMAQNIGAACVPCVKPGERVCVGQVVGGPEGSLGAPVHASVSGKVAAVEPRPHVAGGTAISVIIEADGKQEQFIDIAPQPELEALAPEALVKCAMDAGLVGMGGATFPTHAKLKLKRGQSLDAFIANGAECESYLTCDDRLMREQPKKVVFGLKAFMKATGAPRGIIGIEDNKPEAIAAMRDAVRSEGNIEVAPLSTRFPQGGEKQLIYTLTGREVPAGGLPADAGCLVDNVATCAAMADYLLAGMPCVSRAITVTGDVAEPQNLVVPIGTSFADCISACGGSGEGTRVIVSGGPMTGFAVSSREASVTKGTSGILLTSGSRPEITPCIRCGDCAKVCPAGIKPVAIEAAYKRGDIAQCGALDAAECIACGCCSYICPAKRQLSYYSAKARDAVKRERQKKEDTSVGER